MGDEVKVIVECDSKHCWSASEAKEQRKGFCCQIFDECETRLANGRKQDNVPEVEKLRRELADANRRLEDSLKQQVKAEAKKALDSACEEKTKKGKGK